MSTSKREESSSGEKQRHEGSPTTPSLSPETRARKSGRAVSASRWPNSEKRKNSKATVASGDGGGNKVSGGRLIHGNSVRNQPKCSRCQYQKLACHGGFPCRACKPSGYSDIECRKGENKGHFSEDENDRKLREEADPFNGRGAKAGFSWRRCW